VSSDFAELVSERRREVQARLASIETQLSGIREARSSANDDDEHDPEGSTLSTEWSRAEGQRADAQRELADLDAARERIATGTYGRCASCGEPIPPGRLRLLPAAALCVPCAERSQAGISRP
jgi:RNA polymerase-binding transcription factor DksA